MIFIRFIIKQAYTTKFISGVPTKCIVTDEESAGTIPGSKITTSVALSYKIPQLNTLGSETYEVVEYRMSECAKLQKLTQNHRNIDF